jgi:hypothetical protein
MHIVESFKVNATLSAYRCVAMVSSTAMMVQYPESLRNLPVGITLDTVKDTVSSIPVQLNGIARLYFNDTVTAGQIVASDTSGRGVPHVFAVTSTSATLASAYLGILAGATIAATGTVAPVIINPGYLRGSV